MQHSPGLLGEQVGRFYLRVGSGDANVDPRAVGRSDTSWDSPAAERTLCPVPSFMRVADGLVGNEMIDCMCDWVFGNDMLCGGAARCQACGPGYAAGRRILAPHNRAAWQVTARICERLGDPSYVSRSVDESIGEGRAYVAPEDLNRVESASLPPHALEMRIGHPYMLLRNYRGRHKRQQCGTMGRR